MGAVRFRFAFAFLPAFLSGCVDSHAYLEQQEAVKSAVRDRIGAPTPDSKLCIPTSVELADGLSETEASPVKAAVASGVRRCVGTEN